jgi:Flp pilus assembly protein CpaB
VTFQVSPAEAELIAFADRVAEMRLLLRNSKDVVIQKELPVIDFSNLIQVEKKIRQKQKSGTRPRIIYD